MSRPGPAPAPRRGVRLIRGSIARFQATDRQRSGFAIFEFAGDGWQGVTTFDHGADRNSKARALDLLDRQRAGILLYRKGG